MGRLNLLLADKDEHYVKRLTEYIVTHHPSVFSLDYVTSEDALKRYIGTHREHLDVLLLENTWNKGLYLGSQTIVAELWAATPPIGDGKDWRLHKFQRGDAIVREVLRKFMEQNPHRQISGVKQGDCPVISVFSPSGGCGKSTIAAGLSILSSQQGKKTIYLNLEGCESTEAFFKPIDGPGISELYYHLKEGATQMDGKIEALSYRDSETGVRYFGSVESLLDFQELSIPEIELLVSSLRQSQLADVILIDMGSGLDGNNLAILEQSDQILLVSSDDLGSQQKVKAFMHQLPVLERKRNTNLSSRIQAVLNCQHGETALSKDTNRAATQIGFDPILLGGLTMGDRMRGTFARDLRVVLELLEEGRVARGIR